MQQTSGFPANHNACVHAVSVVEAGTDHPVAHAPAAAVTNLNLWFMVHQTGLALLVLQSQQSHFAAADTVLHGLITDKQYPALLPARSVQGEYKAEEAVPPSNTVLGYLKGFDFPAFFQHAQQLPAHMLMVLLVLSGQKTSASKQQPVSVSLRKARR